ncbi:MAG: GAF domain-containing protein, partial [Ignavibacteriales bacterium]|nr:GAF domain-containing protein [Ignavibacteriales bacterium]
LFHLPTAEVFERKQSELTSLHNLSRLVTQVFDFPDLVNTVTSMTLEVVGAKSAWLELIKGKRSDGQVLVEVVALKNITREQIEAITVDSEFSLRQLVLDSKRSLLIDDVANDRRTKHIKKLNISIGSLISVPLLSHNEIIGILHATKDFQYGFDQDDIDVLTTFADHVGIAIENSKLIAKSLERERFQQEMMVAQQMQKRLLPQKVPHYVAIDIAALSEPSLEVGGWALSSEMFRAKACPPLFIWRK